VRCVATSEKANLPLKLVERRARRRNGSSVFLEDEFHEGFWTVLAIPLVPCRISDVVEEPLSALQDSSSSPARSLH